MDTQMGQVEVATPKFPSMKDKLAAAEVLKTPKYSTSVDGEYLPVGPATRESSMEDDLEDSNEEQEEDQPDKVCCVSMIVEEEYDEDAPSFAYTSLCVALNILFDQIDGCALHSREDYDLPPITSMTGTPHDIKGLEKYFSLSNPR